MFTYNEQDDARVNKEPKVKSLYKAISLLDYFTASDYELSIKELSEKSGLLKSSVHNIMSTFLVCDIVEQNSENSKYRIGKKPLGLANIYLSRNTLQQKLRKLMSTLSNELNETIYYAIPYETSVIYLNSVSPKSMLAQSSPITGLSAPMYCTGIGKAMLAFSDQDLIEKINENEMRKFTDNTITSIIALRQEIEITRLRGYSIDNMEHEFGVKCVGCPIIDNETLVGALSVSGPSLRFTNEKIEFYAKKLKELIRLLFDMKDI